MTKSGIKSLIVFKKLEVGPVIVEADRLKAIYKIIRKDKSVVQNELIYSYTEKVFDNTPDDINLSSMIVAQVALNYGLFFEEICFDGLYDDTDKRFILDVLENTSREIYVNKILFPNEFLKDPYNKLIPEKQKRYTLARVSFKNSMYAKASPKWLFADTDKDKYLVLSSGGKDSLLSYGILKELNKDVFPVFINESGRHWYTALNAFKYLSETETRTSRVWCNSDRIFNWILREMPIIREDFAKIRADYYPIRLWTVAVFLFGALPYAHKQGIGNIIIGDEYDTTIKSNYQGITHYNGLYDQSKYFDNALTRYYLKKGWDGFQYSLLRSLSELLILKILVKRYPELQQHQVSCHAAHEKDGRIYPCGKCEKCRRIVSMLLALDESPEHCGYNREQIEYALKSIGSKGIKQIGSDAAHLFYLLKDRNLLAPESENAKLARNNSYITKLRFDKERSSLIDIPRYIRQDVLNIFLQYADGSVILENKQWKDFRPFTDPQIEDPYIFELRTTKIAKQDIRKDYKWETYTWPEMEQVLRNIDTAILPCGSIEQHGPHLPLDIDYFDSVYLANQVAEACESPRPLVLPPIPYGVAYHHDDFKGTISISNQTLSALVYDIGTSLWKNGIKKLIIINGHGDNSPTLHYAAQTINRDTGMFVCVESGETSDTDLESLIDTPNDIHAGEIETSTTLDIRPELVQMDKAVNETLNFGSSNLDYSSDRGVAWYVKTSFISESGVMGDPTKANAQKGQKMWKIMIAHLVKFVEEIKRSRLEDLYQKRY